MTTTRAVTLLDYGMGNLRSVQRALEAAGATVRFASTAAEAAGADRLVVPGQGAFAECMQRLTAAGLDDLVRAHVASGRPYLGLCLGLQILFDESDEHGPTAGLGLVPGRVVRFPPDLHDAEGRRLKVPHMGWSQVHPAGLHPVWDGLRAGGPAAWFYFVHSYTCRPDRDEDVALQATHGVTFCAGYARDATVAVQFHPEKSQATGHDLLRRFLTL